MRSSRFHRIFIKSSGFHGIFTQSSAFHRIFIKSSGFHRMFIKSSGFHRMFVKSSGLHGILMGFPGFHGIFQRFSSAFAAHCQDRAAQHRAKERRGQGGGGCTQCPAGAPQGWLHIPCGKHTKNYGKSQCFMGKLGKIPIFNGKTREDHNF